MKQNVFVINRQVKARALDALSGNFFSVLKVMFVPTVLYMAIAAIGNDFLSSATAIVYGMLMLGFFPHASTLMALQARDANEARAYAKSWSWFALFKVWANRLNMGVDYLVFTVLLTVLGLGSLFGFLMPAVLVGTFLDGFTFLGVIASGVILVSWVVIAVWVSLKLGLNDFVFADAIFGDMSATAFNDVNFAKMSMMQRLGAIISTSWTLMTWRVFWRYVWFFLTFIGWFLLGTVTLGLGMLFAVPYALMASVAFYEQVVSEKYGQFSEEESVATISTRVLDEQ